LKSITVDDALLEDKEQLEDYLILHNKAKLEKQNINKANF
jgi:DNA-binding protein YbaB